MNGEALTIRQKILRILEQGPATARDISQEVGISEKDVPFHLASVEKSLRRQNRKLEMTPGRCLACGFVFSRGNRFKKPGRCPGCREGRITSPAFLASPAPR